MDIYICTYGRAHKQTTWEQLPQQWQNKAVLVVQEREAHLYEDYPIYVLPDHIRNLPDTRQHLRDLSREPCIQMDDDLVFYARRVDDPTKFRQATDTDIHWMLSSMQRYLGTRAHVGVSHREGANRNIEDVLYNTRQMRIHGFRRDILQDEDIVHNRLPDVEDFDVTLQLLKKGYANAVLNEWVHNQAGSQAEGGVSTYRTIESHNRDVERLAELHPEHVTVVQKANKGEWGHRKDVRIQWKKAFDYGTARRGEKHMG